jgi:hypothetical protein
VLAQLLAEPDQREDAQRARKLVPANAPIEEGRHRREKALKVHR